VDCGYERRWKVSRSISIYLSVTIDGDRHEIEIIRDTEGSAHQDIDEGDYYTSRCAMDIVDLDKYDEAISETVAEMRELLINKLIETN
jgi:hypothetical protein